MQSPVCGVQLPALVCPHEMCLLFEQQEACQDDYCREENGMLIYPAVIIGIFFWTKERVEGGRWCGGEMTLIK